MMNVKIDGLKLDMAYWKASIKGDMECLKECMEVLNLGLMKLLQERLPNGDKLLHENHDENKRNLNHYFREFNFGFNTNHIKNVL